MFKRNFKCLATQYLYSGNSKWKNMSFLYAYSLDTRIVFSQDKRNEFAKDLYNL